MALPNPNTQKLATTLSTLTIIKMKALLQNLIHQGDQMFKDIWQNRDGIAPDVLIAAMTTDALSIFTNATALMTFINSIQPGAVNWAIPAGWAVTFAQDNSATAVYTPPAPPSAS